MSTDRTVDITMFLEDANC